MKVQFINTKGNLRGQLLSKTRQESLDKICKEGVIMEVDKVVRLSGHVFYHMVLPGEGAPSGWFRERFKIVEGSEYDLEDLDSILGIV